MNNDRDRIRHVVATGMSAWDREDYQHALETFEGILAEHPGFADVHNKAGLCQAMLDRAALALEHFDQALRINPSYAEAHLNRAIVLNELGRHEEATISASRAGELDTRDSKIFPSELGNRLAVTHATLGDMYLVAEQPDEAAKHYLAALDVRPRFVDIRSKYAEALIELGRLGQAREELEAIIDERPGFSGARLRLGVVLKRLGDVEGATAAWRRCADEAPDDMRPRAYLASLESPGDGREPSSAPS